MHQLQTVPPQNPGDECLMTAIMKVGDDVDDNDDDHYWEPSRWTSIQAADAEFLFTAPPGDTNPQKLALQMLKWKFGDHSCGSNFCLMSACSIYKLATWYSSAGVTEGAGGSWWASWLVLWCLLPSCIFSLENSSFEDLSFENISKNRGEICPSRHSWRECEIFASVFISS